MSGQRFEGLQATGAEALVSGLRVNKALQELGLANNALGRQGKWQCRRVGWVWRVGGCTRHMSVRDVMHCARHSECIQARIMARRNYGRHRHLVLAPELPK